MAQPTSNPPEFLELLKEVLDGEEAEKRERYKDAPYRHYPSSASIELDDKTITGECLRKIFYRANKEPESNKSEFSNALQRLFGDAIHDSILKKLSKNTKITIMPEVGGRVTVTGLKKEISFRVDGLVNYRGELGGFELKTTQGRGLEYMVKETGGYPKADHLLQVATYLAVNDGLQWYSMVYVARDSGYRAEYHVAKQDGTWVVRQVFPFKNAWHPLGWFNFSNIGDRWQLLEKYLEDNTLPPRDFKVVFNEEGKIVDKRQKHKKIYKTDFRCRYCNYRDTCWQGEEAKKDAYQIPA